MKFRVYVADWNGITCGQLLYPPATFTNVEDTFEYDFKEEAEAFGESLVRAKKTKSFTIKEGRMVFE